ncbi:MAG: IS110 family transposase [Candidatus Omnitrophica bacterium]|nr:IS110 family transposase [Candidatus Omnitrophota bacterium]MCM8827924.1 IS110 family transposase [Candidatus Omnitrophota bacterium]
MNLEYFCGIDVSKSSFCIAVKNDKFVIDNEKFGMDKEGFDALEERLSRYKGKILIGMESTGVYHTNLFYFLQNKSYNSCIVNPYKMKQFFKFITDKPTKTDKKDAKAICQFVEINKDSANVISGDEKYQLRYLVRERATYSTGCQDQSRDKKDSCGCFP